MYDGDALDRAALFALAHSSGMPSALIERAVLALRAELREQRVFPSSLYCVRVPLLVYAALTGEEDGALPLATALTLVHLGTELLDDAMDGDLAAIWRDVPLGQVVLVAGACCAPLAQLALAAIDAPAAALLRMQSAFSRGLLRMIGGQAADRALAESVGFTVEEVIAASAGKCGAAIAMYACLAAQLACASARDEEAYAEFGRWLGVAAQARSEYVELFIAAEGRDLKAGARTLPLALHLEQLAPDTRAEFIALLTAARVDADAQQAVRGQLLHAGTGRVCLLMIEAFCQRARAALNGVIARDEPRAALLRLIDGVSLLHAKQEAPLLF